MDKQEPQKISKKLVDKNAVKPKGYTRTPLHFYNNMGPLHINFGKTSH